MNLPLYQDVRGDKFSLGEERNYGLWFEKYFSAYTNLYEKDETNFRNWLEKFNNKKIGDKQHISLINRALSLRLLANSQQGKVGVFLVKDQLVTGMGLPHPIENGFLWHPTLGMPYIPGSIVKGIVRSLIETSYSLDNKEEQENILLRWFGSKDKFVDSDTGNNQTGSLVFLDALPVKPCRLHLEIMTPHMGNWYDKGGKSNRDSHAIPGDWHSPNPVSYLVARDLSLQFIIMPRASVTVDIEQAKEDVKHAWKALLCALDWIGAGAKTAIGFGRMMPDEVEENKLKNHAESVSIEQRTAAMTTEQLSVEKVRVQLAHDVQYNIKEPTGILRGVLRDSCITVGATNDLALKAELRELFTACCKLWGVDRKSNAKLKELWKLISET